MKDSYWINETEKKQSYPCIEKEMDTNIAIIGAGLSGLSTAYYLSKATNDVFVIEADQVCYGASGRNTGKLTMQHGVIYKDLMAQYDKIIARQYYHANEEALNSIEQIIQEHQIDCGFERCDALLYTQDPVMAAELQDEYQAYLDLHIPCTYLEQQEGPIPYLAGLKMHYQARFNPYAYGLALAEIVHQAGISIYEHSPVETMIEEEDGTYTLLVNHHKIHANQVIFTSQFPFIDHSHLYFTRMYCEQESIAACTSTSFLPEDMMLNVDKPSHSFNTTHQVLLAAGNSYKSGQTPEVQEQEFLAYIHQTFHPEVMKQEWTSQDYISFDKIPFIGKLDKHNEKVLFASGFSKWGNTTSNIAGKLLCSYALGQGSQYRMLYSPQRFSTIFSLPFVKENLNVAYEFIKGKFKKGDEDYPRMREGKHMQIDGHTYGVYRDEQEELFIVDVTCPHLGCVCNFNAVDKTWDCPCHGSRFSYKGEIIKGPATHKLNAYGEGLNPVNPHVMK